MQINSSDRDQSNITRLLKALHHQEPTCLFEASCRAETNDLQPLYQV